MPLDKQSWRNHFWTAQLIAGPYAAIHTIVQFHRAEGWLWSLGMAAVAFVAVVPLAAAITTLMVWREGRRPPGYVPRTRWIKVPLLALAVCVVIFGTLAWIAYP